MTPYRGARAAVLLLAVLATRREAAAQVVINEVDYDQPGTDSAEFIEILNTGADPVDLDTFALVLVNGDAAPVEYGTIDLPAVELAAGDYYVVCGDATTVPECDLDVSPDINLVENGAPDAIELRDGGTAVDTVSYEGTVAGFSEGTGDAGDDGDAPFLAMARFPDGTDTGDNDADFSVRCATPGAANATASSLCRCGNGSVDEGEVCDEGSGNGTSECGCTAECDYAGTGTSCGDPSASECDQPDVCDGAGSCSPNPAAAGDPCGDDVESECDLADACDGAGTCNPNLVADGEPCGDPTDTECTDPDDCQEGVCVTNDAVEGQSCGNQNPGVCDQADICDGAGNCDPNPMPAGGPCGDGTDDDCTDPDTCDGGGSCQPNDEPDDTPCGNGAFCDGDETCEQGMCEGGAAPCADGEECDEAADQCRPSACGDGAVAEEEECDDGNRDDGDGCTGCAIDVGWVCGDDPPTDGTSDCTMSCGDGEVDLYESCDDHDVDPGDGCDEHCQVEPGWDCFEDEEGQPVCAPMCGDGVVLADEECDDGNLGREDGCSHCQVEVGWLCDDGEPTECSQLPDDGGCSCRATGGRGGALWLIALLLLGWTRRRRAA